jgi:signal transduction histidine kinase
MPETVATTPLGRFAHSGVLLLTVLVFAGAVVAVTLQLRTGLRDQTLRREASMLAAVTAMQLDNSIEEFGPLDEVPEAIYFAVLKTSKLRGVSGFRIFDARQQPAGAWGLSPADGLPAADTWQRLEQSEPFARMVFRRSAAETLEQALGPAAENGVEAWVPLRSSQSPALLGAVEFWLDGKELAGDFADHDRRLWIQAAIAWLTGSAVIVVTLGWALRRLSATNRKLRARSEDLQRANRELMLAAKTSALGAVTAHLMHELKNPLAGLELIVAGQGERRSTTERGEGELAAASELTKRLRTMVNDVVGVLRDEQTGAEFELTPTEVAEIVMAKVKGEAIAKGIILDSVGASELILGGRRGNLATLVLRNLMQNAIEATPPGGRVRLTAGSSTDGGAEFTVEDSGGGLPETLHSRLFQPCVSTKPGGSGLGLALSYQLAQQAGGRLELLRSDGAGTVFRLRLAPAT